MQIERTAFAPADLAEARGCRSERSEKSSRDRDRNVRHATALGCRSPALKRRAEEWLLDRRWRAGREIGWAIFIKEAADGLVYLPSFELTAAGFGRQPRLVG